MNGIFIFIILLLSIISIPYKCQDLKFTCLGNRPFKNKDLDCSDFSEICVKKGDPECEGFQAICQQCPPSNMTVNALLTLLALSKSSKDVLAKKIDQAVQQQKYLEKQLDYTADKFLRINLLIMTLFFVLILILCFEIRFKLFTKFREKITKKGRKRLYRIQKKEIYKNIKEPIGTINQCDELAFNSKDTHDRQFQKNLDDFLIKMTDILEMRLTESHYRGHKSNKEVSRLFINFRLNNTETLIKLKISSHDNVVEIKRQICAKCIDGKLNYKQMQLKYKDRILDDNQYLLSNVESIDDIVQCEINNEINPSDIVVLKVHGNMKIPGLMQVNRNQTIADLKKIISSFNNSTHTKIFKQRIELNENQTVEKCVLLDKEVIQVIGIENEHLIMHSIVGDADPILIGYSNVDLVSSVKKTLTAKLTHLCDEIILYDDSNYLDGDKYFFELEIPRSSEIEYWRLLKLNRLNITLDPLVIGNSSKILTATDKASNRDIFIKMYKFESTSNWSQSKAILYELKKSRLTKSHPRFVQQGEFYFDEKQFGVSIEYLKQSMRDYMWKNSSIPENRIAKWSKQILEGLQVLHQHKVVYRDMKSSDIFLDEDDNTKISGFGLFKYVYNDDSCPMKGLVYKVQSTTRYPPPEVINKNTFDMHSDVWSFGSILLKMVTGNGPYQGIQVKDLTRIIEKNENFQYEFNVNTTAQLQSLIQSCLKTNPKDRMTVDDLLRHEFLTTNGL